MSDPEKNYGTDTDLAEKNSGIDNFWDDPRKIMNLIDLLFLWDDPDRKQVCS